MITITFVFWMFVFLGAIIGAMRGWAKELLVIFSVILAIFIILVIERFVPFIGAFIKSGGPQYEFWIPSIIILIFAYFGYQTPNSERFRGALRREKLQDSLLGVILGGFNGYMIIGSIWSYLDTANYPFEAVIAPAKGDALGETALRLISLLPPEWLSVPGIYFAIAVAFAFIVIVFV